MQHVQVSESGMEKFLESLICEYSIFTLSRGTSGSNGGWKQWSSGYLEAEHRKDETVEKR